MPAAYEWFLDNDGEPIVDAVVHTMSFAMGASSPEQRTNDEWATDVLRRLDVPQIQAINAGISAERWRESESGLPPLDVAMNVAIPELDGRIIGVPVAFKEEIGGPGGERLTQHCALARVTPAQYDMWFDELPARRANEMRDQWGEPQGAHYVDDSGTLALAGLRSGNVFVAVQPPRGYGMDKTAIMHRPDLAPQHPYYAMYRWLAEPRPAIGSSAVRPVPTAPGSCSCWTRRWLSSSRRAILGRSAKSRNGCWRRVSAVSGSRLIRTLGTQSNGPWSRRKAMSRVAATRLRRRGRCDDLNTGGTGGASIPVQRDRRPGADEARAAAQRGQSAD